LMVGQKGGQARSVASTAKFARSPLFARSGFHVAKVA
jgi:hypothetical protein